MATSRRRERELARRRFERRRQAALEQRAKAKKRNTVVGAVVGTIVLVGALVGIGFAVFGGSSKPNVAAIKPGASTSAAASPSAATSTSPAPAAPTKCAKISPDPTKAGQPKIPQVKGKLTDKLVSHDIKVGKGPAAKAGDSLAVYYIGISCDTGKVFDASYLHTPLATFAVSPLGTANVITGWNQGLVGMKAGGVRELVIPEALAYGATGDASAGIPGNDTLVFLVTAKSVTPA